MKTGVSFSLTHSAATQVMKPKIWIHKSNSFAEAANFDENYYSQMSMAERLEVMQFLRESFFRLNRDKHLESGKRLRRILTVVK